MPILHKQNAYSAQETGAGAVQFLIGHFTFLGFDGQYWMIIVAALIAAFVVFAWRTRDRA
jgi:hypothetical protein